MAIRTYDELLGDGNVPLPNWPGDDPERQAKERPWWAGLDATHTRYRVTCPGMEHRVGVIESPEGHLHFRPHLIPTYGGSIWCPRTLERLCDLPPERRGSWPRVIRCAHERVEVKSA